MKNTVTIERGATDRAYWSEFWKFRELLYVLSWRDISVRYRQTVVGILWALIRPALTLVVFTVVFGKLAGMPTCGTAPYAVMVLAGMIPWNLFSSVLTQASDSMVANSGLVTKVYFPRMVIPASAAATALVDFAVNFLMLAGLMIYYCVAPTWKVATLPLFIVMAVAASAGIGLWLTALNVKYRDVRYMVPFMVQIGLYVSPVGFSSAVVPERWQVLYGMNPIVGVIDGFRWVLVGGANPMNNVGFFVSVGVILFFLWFGIKRFKDAERGFADVI